MHPLINRTVVAQYYDETPTVKITGTQHNYGKLFFIATILDGTFKNQTRFFLLKDLIAF